MAKTVPDKPQALVDTQFLLTWQGSARTDKVHARIANELVRVNPLPSDSALSTFCKSDAQANGLLLDLSRAPQEISSIDFSFEVAVGGERSWTIEGLNSGEVWQNNSVSVVADIAATVLTIERQDSGWFVIAREQVEAGDKLLEQDSQVPEEFRELWRLLSSKPAPELMRHCEAIFEVTSSWHRELPRELRARLVQTLVAIATVATSRPIEVSLQGLSSVTCSVDDEIEASFELELEAAEENRAEAAAMFALVPSIVESIKPNSRIYVFVESLFFIDDDLLTKAEEKRVELIVLVANAASGSFDDIESDFLKVKRLPDADRFSSKNLVDLLY